jgi:hypothetical protein
MPDYTTLAAQVELFKDKVDALSATTLDANELVLLASALKALGEGMGVNDIIDASTSEIARITDAAGAMILEHDSSLTALESWRPNVDNYINTNQQNLQDVLSDISTLQSTTASIPAVYKVMSDITYNVQNREQLFLQPDPVQGQTIVLPTGPALGDFVILTDISGLPNLGTGDKVKIDPGNKLIMGVAGIMNFDVDYASIQLTYSNEAYGWRIS